MHPGMSLQHTASSRLYLFSSCSELDLVGQGENFYLIHFVWCWVLSGVIFQWSRAPSFVTPYYFSVHLKSLTWTWHVRGLHLKKCWSSTKLLNCVQQKDVKKNNPKHWDKKNLFVRGNGCLKFQFQLCCIALCCSAGCRSSSWHTQLQH